MKNITNLMNTAFRTSLKEETEEFERILRTDAVPPIKGDITFGKLKWRGISRIVSTNGDQWLEQRKVRIGPVIPNPVDGLIGELRAFSTRTSIRPMKEDVGVKMTILGAAGGGGRAKPISAP